MTDRRTLPSAALAVPVLGAAPRGATIRPQTPDQRLRALLREIDPRRLEATVRRLVAFGTRHTLSSQTDPVRGIGAARDWILGEFQRYAAASAGRLTVALQSYVQQPVPRIPTATTITNVVARVSGLRVGRR